MVVINTIHFIILNNAYNIANNAGYCWLFTWLLLILWLFIIGLLYMVGYYNNNGYLPSGYLT